MLTSDTLTERHAERNAVKSKDEVEARCGMQSHHKDRIYG
jgi:hypothetical protein